MTAPRRPVFPFTALVGQERMKRALVLNAVNPRIGGVLVRGEKGTAKSTAVRALAGLLPDIAVIAGCRYACDPAEPDTWCDDCQGAYPAPSLDGKKAASPPALPVAHRRVPLVSLPMGATEDRVVGTLDLERAIQAGERHFEPGLLAAVNRGILYVDEVNLLVDHLVDVLLDAVAMGVNYVEREGVSVQHPAALILVGTMNPEEGDLRPQLLDRFALAVEVEGVRDPDARAEVVRRRVAFEADPRAFGRAWAAAEAAERERIQAARALLPSVRLDDRLLGLIARLCCDFEVDGLRADIVMYKAALTLAAYAGRRRVSEDDVREAAELALLHRRRRQPFDQPELDRERLDDSIRDYLQHQPPEGADDAGGADEPPRGGPTGNGQAPDEPPADEHESEGDAERPPPERVFAPGRAAPPPMLAATAPRHRQQMSRGRRSRALLDPRRDVGARGHYVRSTAARDATWADLALDATLRAAAPHQPARRARAHTANGAGRPAVLLARDDLHLKVRQAQLRNLILFVVDASGSMAARDRMSAAKGAVLALLLDAYRKRDEVGLVAFRGRGAELLLPPTRSVELAAARLATLPTGGRTPLAEGLALASTTLERHQQRNPGTLPLLVLITDGRANVALNAGRARGAVPVGGAGGLADVGALGARLQRQGATTVVIDSEAGALRLGLARQVAAALGGRYLALGGLSAAGVARAVREARA
jgi:magnesium chelatase subunit D